MRRAATIVLVGVSSLVAAVQCRRNMGGDHMGTTINGLPGQSALPTEPHSSAEILAATHLFTVETLGLSDTPWTKGPDGLEHRQQTMEFRLLERFKGDLDIRTGDAFRVEVPQNRESALETSDYHGFWSHQEIQKGERYLVLASGPASAPTLLREPAIQALHPEALVADVRAAMSAEHGLEDARRRSAAPAEALRKLLDQTYAERARLRGLYGRYAWARTEPSYAGVENELFPEIVKVVSARDATVELRQALIEGLYQFVSATDPSEERALRLARPLLGLLLQPEAAPLVERLAQVEIYNLVFHGGSALAPAHAVVADPAERAAMRSALAVYPSERASQISSWLSR
jgi:hypothetical protein